MTFHGFRCSLGETPSSPTAFPRLLGGFLHPPQLCRGRALRRLKLGLREERRAAQHGEARAAQCRGAALTGGRSEATGHLCRR